MKNLGRQSKVRAEGLVKPLARIHIKIHNNTSHFIIYSTPSCWQQRRNRLSHQDLLSTYLKPLAS